MSALSDIREKDFDAQARAKTAEENLHKNESRVKWWLENYDITMPCGHKNRYLLDCVCVMCRLENAAEIEAELKGM